MIPAKPGMIRNVFNALARLFGRLMRPLAAVRLAGPAALVFCLPALAQVDALPAAVSRALADAGIPASHVAVVVRGVAGEPPLLSHNAKAPMNPASVMKLVTTYAALETLGPAYTWKTDALTETPPDGGRLTGNLYLRGSGDPRLGLEQFWLFLRQLKAHGISDIDGDLVLDRSVFALPPHDPGEFDNEPLRPYNAGPDALLVNLKSLSLVLHPDPGQGRVQLWHETPGAEALVRNQLSLTTDGCGDWREKLKTEVDGDMLTLRGNYATACGDKALGLSPWPATRQVELLFRSLWRELGGTLSGLVRDGIAPATASPVATQVSPPLAEVVREINKFSNNVMARQVFLTLDPARPATPDGAARGVRQWLAGKGIDLSGLVLENGAGLSRRERVSADALSRLLLAAWQSPVMPELMASLPLAGVDGTLRLRLRDQSPTGRAHLKTGYLDNARALAGYVLDNGGRRWVLVCLINDARSGQGKAAMDALLRWIVERGAVQTVASPTNTGR